MKRKSNGIMVSPRNIIIRGGSSNGGRAACAEDALVAWRQAKGEAIDESNVRDLLADIGHLCDREGMDFEAEVKTALMNWRAEK